METVCLIGKPNVGKSTIFNRLLKEKKAIIMDTPGITRDRIYGTVQYKEKKFHLIDTGGIVKSEENIDKNIAMQAELGIDEADKIIFVVDGLSDLDASDYYVRDLLKKSGKQVFVVVNKLDNKEREENVYYYYELGFEKLYPVSAEHNIGFDKLMDALTDNMNVEEEIKDDSLRFCFIGRPNVGKSSLVNAMLNEDRLIVSDVAGTTRDAVDTEFKYNGEKYTVIDTAGMRKKGRIYEDVEKYSLLRSLKAIDRSNVCVLVIDAFAGVIEHDKHILSYAIEAGKGIVIAVNKWDLIEDPNTAIKKWNIEMAEYFKFVPYASIVYLSAKTKKRMGNLMPEIIKAYENNRKYLNDGQINTCIEDAYAMHAAPSYKGKRLKIYNVHQSANEPPKFTFDVNSKNLVHFSYERYLENCLRKAFDLTGTPIILQFKNHNE